MIYHRGVTVVKMFTSKDLRETWNDMGHTKNDVLEGDLNLGKTGTIQRGLEDTA